MAVSIANADMRVLCIAPETSVRAHLPGVDVRYVDIPLNKRLLRQWTTFAHAVDKHMHHVSAQSFWAADLWSLRAAVRAASLCNATVLYDSREIYSALAELHKRPFMQLCVSIMESLYVRKADRVCVSGELDAEVLRRILKLSRQPDVILNVPSYTAPTASQRLRERCQIPAGDFIVVYQGAVLEGRGIGLLMDAMEFAPRMHACIIGEGPSFNRYAQYADTKEWSERLHMIGSVPNHELALWTASADVGFCCIEPLTLSYELALPHKLFEYAMAGLPVCLSDLPAMRRVIEQYPFGECIATDSTPAACASVLQQLVLKRDVYRPQALAAAKVFNRERQEERIVRMAKEMVGRHD